jgi:hypothetical protein
LKGYPNYSILTFGNKNTALRWSNYLKNFNSYGIGQNKHVFRSPLPILWEMLFFTRGDEVVEALRYKPEGSGIDSR